MESLQELQQQLLLVNAAITKILSGERIIEFEIGSGSSSRRYRYEEVSLEMLQKEKTRILTQIEVLSASEPTFRSSSRMQTLYRKI